MTHLQSCYFCGTTGALSEYEMPAGADDSPPRMTLCTRCHTKLTNVLTPILDQHGDLSRSDGSEQVQLPSAADAADEAGTDDDNQTTAETATQPEVTFSSAATDERPNEEASADDGSPTAVESTSDAAADFDADSAVESDTENESSGDDVETVGESEETDAAHEEETGEREAVDAAADTDGHDAVPDDAEATDGPAETAETADVEAEAENATAPDGDDDFPAELERVYHKLLRFLRNREFPIPRGEAEAVAQSAYDLTEREASQVLQRAVDKGVLEERDGELHRN